MMRIGGLASGIDTENIIKQLMQAERAPLNKMEQEMTMLEWKREDFREINSKMLELDNMMLDMQLSSTYNSKQVSSTQEDAVTATATTNASNGAYSIDVNQLATSAMKIGESSLSTNGETIDTSVTTLADLGVTDSETKFAFTTYDENRNPQEYEHTFSTSDTLDDVMQTVNEDDNNVRLFYVAQNDQMVMETTRTGNYNEDGDEIEFSGNNGGIADTFGLTNAKEIGGTNAEFTYNGGLKNLEARENNYTLNGITFQFNNITDGAATLNITNDVDAAVDNIMSFVDTYNEVVDLLNGTQQEERYRDYPPLTDAQREEMDENEIELWNERAKSGILKGENIITEAQFDMRQSWYGNVENDGVFSNITEIGITTSADYLDGGKLVVDEEQLTSALQEDPDSVYQIFASEGEGAEAGIIQRLENGVEQTMNRIEERAGKGSDTLENYTIGKRMSSLEDEIAGFEDRLTNIEDQYWSEFNAMEQAISMFNQQSTMLAQMTSQ